MNRVLENLQPVGTLHERLELRPDLVLAGRGDLVMMNFDFDAHLFHREAHRGANIL